MKALIFTDTHFYNKLTSNGVIYTTLGSFSENDGTGKPSKSYGILDFSENSVSFDVFKL